MLITKINMNSFDEIEEKKKNIKDEILSSKPKIYKCIVAWSDLLGFSNALIQNDWSISPNIINTNFKRVQSLQALVVSEHSPADEKIFMLNDGLARNFDIDIGHFTFDNFAGWLFMIIRMHTNINLQESFHNHPGLRTVLSFGERSVYGIEKLSLSSYIEGFGDMQDVCPIIYSPFEFQMNLAFSRAYILENAGSRIGLTGNGLYIDGNLFEWIINNFSNNFKNITCRPEENLPWGGITYEKIDFCTSITEKQFVIKGVREYGDNICFSIDFSRSLTIDYKGIKTTIYQISKCARNKEVCIISE